VWSCHQSLLNQSQYGLADRLGGQMNNERWRLLIKAFNCPYCHDVTEQVADPASMDILEGNLVCKYICLVCGNAWTHELGELEAMKKLFCEEGKNENKV